MSINKNGGRFEETHSSLFACAISLLLAGCAGAVDPGNGEVEDDDPSIEVNRQEILGGTVGGGVGAIELAGASGSCSGSLVGEHMLVTAAHCFSDLGNALLGTVSRRVNYAQTGTSWRCMTDFALGRNQRAVLWPDIHWSIVPTLWKRIE